jgi:DNA-damage-inducible protein J
MDKKLKDDASALFAGMGMDISTAVKLFLTASLQERELPFTPKWKEPAEIKSLAKEAAQPTHTLTGKEKSKRLSTVRSLFNCLPSTVTDEEVKNWRIDRYESLS